MYFASIETCNWYASRIVKRYGNYSYSSMVPPEHRATAYCKPVYVDKTKVLYNGFRWRVLWLSPKLETRQDLINNCLTGRGYNVINK